MSRFPISKAGARELHDLSTSLSGSIDDLSTSNTTLTHKISSLGELGDYNDEIEDIVGQVTRVLEEGRGSAERLANKVELLANDIEGMLTL